MERLYRVFRSGIAVAAMVHCGAAFAQPAEPAPAAPGPVPAAEEGPSGIPVPQEGPGGIPVGPLIAYPGVELRQGHNDNLFSSNINKHGSSQTVLVPYVSVEGKVGQHKFGGLFRYEHGSFSSSTADNYNDYFLDGRADLVFSGRAGLGLHAAHRYGHDPRGSTDRGIQTAPDEYTDQGTDGVFRYGAPGAQGRIEVNGGYFERRYQNNRATTVVADRNTGTLGGTFFWRVAPKTEILANTQHTKIGYQLSSSTQSSTEDRYYLGAKWDATALTSGTVKFGRMKKEFPDASRSDFSGSSWDVGVTWKPRTYSTLDFVTSRQTNESTGVGDTLITNLYGVTWSHAWSSRFRTQLTANKRQDTFFGSNSGGRVDDNKTYGLALVYQFRRWLRFGAEYTRTNRESNNSIFDYERNQWFFSVGATL